MNLAVSVYFQVLHSHSKYAKLSLLVAGSDELAVHSCQLLCLEKQVRKVASRLACCHGLYL